MIKRFVNKHRKQVIRLEFLLFMPIFVLRNLVFNTDCKKVKRPRFRTQIVCSKLLTLPAYCLKLNCERMTNRCFCCYQGRSQKFAKGGTKQRVWGTEVPKRGPGERLPNVYGGKTYKIGRGYGYTPSRKHSRRAIFTPITIIIIIMIT